MLFALALALRLLYWQASPDAAAAWPAAYKGDAPVWLDYAAALERGVPFELGLPLRPPGAGYLVATLAELGAGSAGLRLAWCLLGAAAVWLLWAAARTAFGERVALVAGLAAAGSHGLIVLSSSLGNDTPYLLLVAACLRLAEPLRRRPAAAALAGWGAVNALACLLRVEHALFFVLVTAWLAAGWARGEGRRTVLRRLPGVAVVFALVLAPWHLHAWSAIARFNRQPPALDPATDRALGAVERATAHLGWEESARRRRAQLPAFTRRTAAAFVAATVAVRGGSRVRGEDFAALDEAFGYIPEPLAGHPFVALYGGLNFRLANHAGAAGGFDRAPLAAKPPLAGGAGRYPLPLVAGLPPPELELTYPPHLELVNHGYREGWRWIASEPAAFARLAAAKLGIFWQGAALGAGGWNLPLGMDGVRRRVDLAVPAAGPVATGWQLAVLAVALAGLWAGRRRPELMPWLLLAASKLVVTVAFFGYARLGAGVIPVLAVLAGLALERATGGPGRPLTRRWLLAAAVAGGLLLTAETARYLSHPEPYLDGRPVASREPFPADEHRDRTLTWSR